jgi:hypothetical protein
MFWYRVSQFRWAFSTPEIAEVKVVKSTPARVYTTTNRFENKVSDYHRWFETYTEAYNFVVETMMTRITRMEREAKDTRDKLDEFRRSQRALQDKHGA